MLKWATFTGEAAKLSAKKGRIGNRLGLFVFLRSRRQERVFLGEFFGKNEKILKNLNFFAFFMFARLDFVL